jgi:ADP-ribose pyrophosphatase YjhB (NUDIX family)
MSSSKIVNIYNLVRNLVLYLQGEEIFEAAIREVKEETGVSILIHSM